MKEIKEEKMEGFDIRVTHRDPKSGAVVRQDPYILRVIGEGGNKRKLFERPKGSGNLWNRQGEPIGRWVKGEFVEGEPHVEFTPPPTQDQLLAQSLVQKDSRIAELERELQAIQAESDAKSKKMKEKGA